MLKVDGVGFGPEMAIFQDASGTRLVRESMWSLSSELISLG